MGKTRMEELFYKLYASSKQHDSWQRYAMVVELRALMKQSIRGSSGSDHFEDECDDDQTFDDKEEIHQVHETLTNPAPIEEDVSSDQSLKDEELAEIEDRAVENEANTKMISAKVKEESIPQSKVSIPQSNSEILKSSEPEKVDLGLEKLEHVVMNEVDGDVERGQEVMSNTTICSAHQLFDQKPNKEKHMKHLKAWKFKFKPTSKRSRLKDDKFSFVDATVLLNKDPQETIWDCVKKEFKETMAACGKNRVDRFKLAEEKESRLQVLDLNQTFMHHQRSTSLTIRDCPDRSSRANRVWKPGGLLCVQDHSGGSSLMTTQPFHGLHLQGIIYMDMKFQEVIVDDVLSVMVCLCVPNKKFEAGLEIYGCETKKQMLLIVKLANRVWERGKLLATHVYCKWSCQDPAIFQPILRFLMNTKQPCLSLRANRVWDPGGSNSEKKTID